MDMSSNTCTPVSNYISQLQGTPSSVKQQSSCTKTSEKSKALLTPCRRVGLKRTSPNVSAKKPLFKKLIQSKSEMEVSTMKTKCLVNKMNQYTVDFNNEINQSCNIMNVGNFSENEIDNVSQHAEEIVVGFNSQTYTNNELKPEIINLPVLESLATKIKEKKNRYKHIELSMLYEKKHDLQSLKELTEKWKQGCQQALIELHQLLQKNGHTLTMPQLLAQFSIKHELIGYTEDVDDFE